MQTLSKAQYIFGITDNKSDIIEIYFFKKKFKAFPQLKKFVAKLKAQKTLYRGLRVTMKMNLTL